jgi:hypothetical protein
MNKKRKQKRFKKRAAPKSFAKEVLESDVVRGYVSGIGLMMFGVQLIKEMSRPVVNSVDESKTIDNIQDADAEIISSKINDK